MIRARRTSALLAAAVVAVGVGLLTVRTGVLSEANRWVFDGVGGSSVSAAGVQPTGDVPVLRVSTLATPSTEQTAAVRITPTARPAAAAKVSVAASSAKGTVVTAKPASAHSTRASATPKATRTTKKPATVPGTVSGAAAEVVRLTNQERQAKGCPALAVDAALTTSASRHSADMAAHDYFDHNSLDGRSPFDRMKAAGYSYSRAAENIAAGQPTAAAVVAGWMKSEGHRANILDCDLTEIGVGVAKGGSYGIYWTQNFGTPR